MYLRTSKPFREVSGCNDVIPGDDDRFGGSYGFQPIPGLANDMLKRSDSQARTIIAVVFDPLVEVLLGIGDVVSSVFVLQVCGINLFPTIPRIELIVFTKRMCPGIL